MTQRRLYSAAVSAGLVLALGLGAWKLAAGEAVGTALLWAGGGLAAALLLGAVADLGLRLQRHDLPKPGAGDSPAHRHLGSAEDE